ncbi:hypothetical protein LLG46_10490 [bacterium]|nr:hypothetical protein [bacterium]
MTVVDSAMTREVMRDISKRSALDLGSLDVHVMRGVIYLRGRLEKIRSSDDIDLHEELHMIVKVLRLKPGIRDVICEVDIKGPRMNLRQ